jgi:hypothetical protein
VRALERGQRRSVDLAARDDDAEMLEVRGGAVVG